MRQDEISVAELRSAIEKVTEFQMKIDALEHMYMINAKFSNSQVLETFPKKLITILLLLIVTKRKSQR
jgi:hypothetical protein